MDAKSSNRRAPYAPVSALRRFFQVIRTSAVPARVDRAYVQRLGVAHNNEWALLSALKFLGVVDERGSPTAAYRRLQTAEAFESTLQGLAEMAYESLLKVDGLGKSDEALIDYFTVTSSASQAKNAARFFREVCRMAGMHRQSQDMKSSPKGHDAILDRVTTDSQQGKALIAQDATSESLRLAARSRLLEKLPICRPEWRADDYRAICDQFIQMLQFLD